MLKLEVHFLSLSIIFPFRFSRKAPPTAKKNKQEQEFCVAAKVLDATMPETARKALQDF